MVFRYSSVAPAAALALLTSFGALAQADFPVVFIANNVSDEISVLRIEQDGEAKPQTVEDVHRGMLERTSQYHIQATERIIDRLAHDIELTSAQVDLCRMLLNEYIKVREDTSAQLLAGMRRWQKEYWKARLPELDESVDLSHLSPQEYFQIQTWRVGYVQGFDPFTDEESVQSRIQARAHFERQARQQRNRAADTIFDGIEGLLDDSQQPHWPRAKRRIKIAMHDALFPPRAPATDRNVRRRPDSHMNILELVESACLDDQELEPFAIALMSPLALQSQLHTVDIAETSLGSVITSMVRFEERYLQAIDTHENIWDRLFDFRARGISQFDPRRSRGAENVAHGAGLVWSARLAFADELKRLAAELIDDDAARRWEERFHSRCCPTLFLPDQVDGLAGRIESMDDAALPADLRESLDTIIEQYKSDRHILRVRLARGEIELQGLLADRHTRKNEELERLYIHRDELESNTLLKVRTLLASFGISLEMTNDAENADDPPDR